jgi:hypothetical protein
VFAAGNAKGLTPNYLKTTRAQSLTENGANGIVIEQIARCHSIRLLLPRVSAALITTASSKRASRLQRGLWVLDPRWDVRFVPNARQAVSGSTKSK